MKYLARPIIWLRERSHRGWWLLAHLVLLTVVTINVYPFVWMLSTSVKTEAEAKLHQDRIIPENKWLLADEPHELSARMAETPLPPEAVKVLNALIDEEQRRAENLRDHVPWRLGLEDYHQLAHGDAAQSVPLAQSRRQLATLEAEGWLQSRRLQYENWGMVWRTMGFWLRTCTTIVLTLAVVYLTVLTCSLVGYCLARQRFPGKPVVVIVVLIAALNVVPGEAVMVPIFLFMRDLSLIGTLWAPILWIVGATASSALLMAGYFLSLPKEVEEAALVDGAGPFRTFFMIALPMAQPMVATIALFAFLGAWNNFMIPLLTTIAHPHMQPLAVAVYDFRGGHAHSWELINAAAAIMVLPVILIFIFLQKRIVAAVAAGAVKG